MANLENIKTILATDCGSTTTKAILIEYIDDELSQHNLNVELFDYTKDHIESADLMVYMVGFMGGVGYTLYGKAGCIGCVCDKAKVDDGSTCGVQRKDWERQKQRLLRNKK